MRYTAKKIATMLLTMVIVSFLTFVAFSLLSGDAATRLLGTEATSERLEALRIELGLNDPLLVRYGRWLWDAPRGRKLHTFIISAQLFQSLYFRL